MFRNRLESLETRGIARNHGESRGIAWKYAKSIRGKLDAIIKYTKAPRRKVDRVIKCMKALRGKLSAVIKYTKAPRGNRSRT